MATLQLSAGLTISCSVLFIPASALMLGMRFYTRSKQKAGLGIDDWLMIPAFLCLVGMQVDMIVAFSKRTIAYADPNFEPGKADESTNLPFWPFELIQVPALAFVKLSIVFFYRRIFNTGSTSWHHWNYWVSAVNEKSYCVATQKLHLSFSISDMILDCIIILLALPMIWNLHMSKARKFAVTGVFGLGLITIAISITRMAIFVQATALRYDPYLDFEYLDTDVIYWSMLETGLAFLTANSIIVYSLLARSSLSTRLRSLRPLLFSSRRSGGSNTGNSFQLEQRGSKPSNSTNVSTSGASTRDDPESLPEGDRHIHVQTEFGNSE